MIMSKREGKAVFMKNEDGATLIIDQICNEKRKLEKAHVLRHTGGGKERKLVLMSYQSTRLLNLLRKKEY